MGCDHRWRKVHEKFLLGGSNPIGYRCVDCTKFVSMYELTPNGIGGIVLPEDELVGPHGGCGNCSDGSVYKKQIVNTEKHTLTIERPDGRIETKNI